MAERKPFDRCDSLPAHSGPNVFPNFLLFSRLVRLAHRPLLAVRDVTFGFKATYTQLLSDVLLLRNSLRQQLDPAIVARVDHGEEVYILLLGPGGYEFTVGFLGVVAFGAAVVPLAPSLPLKEALYFAKKANAVAILTAEHCIELGSGIRETMVKSTSCFREILLRPHVMQPCMNPEDFQVSSDRYVDLNAPAYVLFTSGTTGPPKGGVKRRGFLCDVVSASMHGSFH